VAKARRIKGLDCQAAVAENARRIIGVRLEELLSYEPYVDNPAYVTELHDLRIAAKRLRYTLELFRFAFPSTLGGLIDEVKEIQEHIGNMHDADVMIERVVEQISTDSTARAVHLMEIASAAQRGTLAQRHQRLRSAMANRTTPRDQVAFYTLIAHRVDDRDQAYSAFHRTWTRLMENEFPLRLRQVVGLEPPEAVALSAELETVAV